MGGKWRTVLLIACIAVAAGSLLELGLSVASSPVPAQHGSNLTTTFDNVAGSLGDVDPVTTTLNSAHPAREANLDVTVSPAVGSTSDFTVVAHATLTFDTTDPVAADATDGDIQVYGIAGLDITPTDISGAMTESAYSLRLDGSQITASYTTTMSTNNEPTTLLLVWSVPKWAGNRDTFSVTVQSRRLAVLAAWGPPLGALSPDSVSATLPARAKSLTVAIGPSGTNLGDMGCTSLQQCAEDGVTGEPPAPGTPSAATETRQTLSVLLGSGSLLLVCIPLLRRRRVAGLLLLSVVSATVAAEFFDLLQNVWDVRLAGSTAFDVEGFTVGLATAAALCGPFFFEPATSSVGRYSRPLPRSLVLLPGAVVLVCAAVLTISPVSLLQSWQTAGSAALAVAAVYAALIVARAPWPGAVLCGLVATWVVISWNGGDSVEPWVGQLGLWAIPLALGLAGAATLFIICDAFAAPPRRLLLCAIVVLFALCDLIPASILHGYTPDPTLHDPGNLVTVAVLALLAAAVLVARDLGASYSVLASSTMSALLFVSFASVIGFIADNWGIVVLCLIITFYVAIPARRGERAVSLAGGSADDRRSAILQLAKQRFLQKYARQAYREAIGDLTKTASTSTEIHSRANAVVDELGSGFDRDAVERAFSAPPGTTPWRNGLFAASLALVLDAPFLWFAFRGTAGQWDAAVYGDQIAYSAVSILGTARAVFFAFAYGFYYARLRGATPLSKALIFTAVLLPADLFCTWQSSYGTPDLAKTLVVEVCQQATIMLLLGAVWELRAMQSVHLPWSMIRSFSSLRSLAAPLGAILVAATTALVTTLASNAIQGTANPRSTPPSPTSSVSASQTPGP